MSDFFFTHEVNPNDTTGGGGCLATGAAAGEDCVGPWIHFHRVSTEHDQSPYASICAKHLEFAADNYDREEVLTGGDPLSVRDLPVSRGSVVRG